MIFLLLETIIFTCGSLDSMTDNSKINEYIFNNKMNEDRFLMLNVIVMMYLSYHDDEYISVYERKQIDNFIKTNLKPFSKDYLHAIKKMKRKVFTIDDIKNYIVYNNIDINSLKYALNRLEEDLFKDGKYHSVMSELKEALKIEEKYLKRMLEFSN